MAEKTEDRIAKEKAAIAAVKSAQGAMSTAIDRIATLEQSLCEARATFEALNRAFNDTLHVCIWHENKYQVVCLNTVLKGAMNKITQVL